MNSSSMEAMATRAAQSPTHSPPPHHHHHHHQSSGSNSCCSNGGVQIHTTTPPLTPISRSDTNPYPTTFVQADTSTFKQVVQMLTGSSETAKQASNSHQDPTPTPPITPRNNSSNFSIPPIRNTPKKQQQQQNSNNFKLYERRNNNHKATLMINTLLPNLVNSSPAGFSPRNKQQEILSPSLLDFPKLTLSSPVTPLNDYDPFNRNSSSSSSSEEDRAIAEKGFYLHPSPMSTPRDSEPQLLSLFPVTSPRILGSSTS